jgi:hypothetical protein
VRAVGRRAAPRGVALPTSGVARCGAETWRSAPARSRVPSSASPGRIATTHADGFFSRPSFARLAFTRIEPNRAAIVSGLRKLEVHELAAVIPLHSHYDHAMDAPLVALQKGAQLIGSESTLNIGRGLGMPAGRPVVVGHARWYRAAPTHTARRLRKSEGAVSRSAPVVPIPCAASSRHRRSMKKLVRIVVLFGAIVVPSLALAAAACPCGPDCPCGADCPCPDCPHT